MLLVEFFFFFTASCGTRLKKPNRSSLMYNKLKQSLTYSDSCSLRVQKSKGGMFSEKCDKKVK